LLQWHEMRLGDKQVQLGSPPGREQSAVWAPGYLPATWRR